MSFPTELNQSALLEIFSQFRGRKVELDRLSLAVYDLVGYGLYKYFGDVKYIANDTPENVSAFNELSNLLTDPKMLEAGIRYLELRAKGFPTWQIIFLLIREFGPLLVLKLRELLQKLNVI
jgi:hypothetical protein